MAIQGSSRIENISGFSSITGPTGPTGAIGPGGTYGRTGPRGNTGFAGHGITFAYGTSTGAGGGLYEHQIIFDLAGFSGGTYGWQTWSDGVLGTTLGVTGVRGSTGDRLSVDFAIWNTIGAGGVVEDFGNYGELFKEKVGPTAHFRNLTISGRDIAVREPTDYMIMLGGLTYGFGRMGITGELLFINPELGGLSAQGAPNTFWSGDQLTAKILTHKELYNEGTDNNNNLTQSDDNKAGDPTNTSAVVSASNIDGTAVTFSSIFADQFNGEGGTGLASGIHMGGGAAGTIHKFAGVTFDSIFSIKDVKIGSCCYCAEGFDRPDHRDCADYVTENYCDGIGGNFSTDVCINRSEGPNCFSEGSCCLNGKCVSTSEEKCQMFGGFFVVDIDCDYIVNELDGCPSPCGERGSCCINSECFELSEYECSFYPNGMWFDKSCEETNCCLEGNYGACCVDEVCYHTTPDMCTKLRTDGGEGPSTGVFWGLGSECAGLHMAEVNGNPAEGYSYKTYYPFNCIDSDGVEHGQLGEDLLCADGTGPPCTGCGGWSQGMNYDDPVVPGEEWTYCLGDDIDCQCEPQGQYPYRCVDSESCGTLWLVNGECWECCRNQPDDYEVMGSCCIEDIVNGWQCITASRETCSISGGHFSIGSCDDVYCNSGSCCSDFNCSMGTPDECSNLGGVWQGFSCNDTDCSGPAFKDYDLPESVEVPEALIGISPKGRKDNRVRRLAGELRDTFLKSKDPQFSDDRGDGINCVSAMEEFCDCTQRATQEMQPRICGDCNLIDWWNSRVIGGGINDNRTYKQKWKDAVKQCMKDGKCDGHHASYSITEGCNIARSMNSSGGLQQNLGRCEQCLKSYMRMGAATWKKICAVIACELRRHRDCCSATETPLPLNARMFDLGKVEEPVAKNQCPESTNILSCIEPNLVVAEGNDNQWTIEVGSGECSCCCPGVCWSGALGDGGIAEDCSEFGDNCVIVEDCFSGNCKSNSSTKSYEISSLPTDVKPICTTTRWGDNELGCTPYMDISNPRKPVWMTCSCCCKNGKCLQFEEPIPCSECEALGINDDCICVNGCDKCFN